MNKILAVRTDRFGEFLLNIPAFRALKRAYPETKLILAVDPYVKELAEAIDFVDGVITWENRRHTWREIWRFSRQLKNQGFGMCVIFNPAKEFNIIAYLAGISRRVGYAHKAAVFLTQKMSDTKYLGLKHEIEYNLELARLAGADTDDKTLSLLIENDIINKLYHEFFLADSDNLIAVHPWTSDPLKQWPLENFRELAGRLAKGLGVKVVLIGGKQERGISTGFFDRHNPNIVDLTGMTTLKQLAVLLKKCRLLISGDSGPVHLASCVGIPVIAIFRNDIPGKGPERWGPRSIGSIVVAKQDLSKITVEEVLLAAQQSLALLQ